MPHAGEEARAPTADGLPYGADFTGHTHAKPDYPLHPTRCDGANAPPDALDSLRDSRLTSTKGFASTKTLLFDSPPPSATS